MGRCARSANAHTSWHAQCGKQHTHTAYKVAVSLATEHANRGHYRSNKVSGQGTQKNDSITCQVRCLFLMIHEVRVDGS